MVVQFIGKEQMEQKATVVSSTTLQKLMVVQSTGMGLMVIFLIVVS